MLCERCVLCGPQDLIAEAMTFSQMTILTTTGRAGRAPEKLLLPLTFGGGNAKLSASFPFGLAMP